MHSQALLMHIEPYSGLFRTLGNPYVYNSTVFRTLVPLEPKVFSKACQTCKMTRDKFRAQAQSEHHASILKDIQGDSEILMHIHPHTQQLGGKGAGLSNPFLKTEKNVLILEKKVLMCPSLSQIFHSKCSFVIVQFFTCFLTNCL